MRTSSLVVLDSARMPIRYQVKEIASLKGFDNARELADAAGLAPATVYGIWNSRNKQIQNETLAKLCRTLGVQPGMLLVYEPEPGDAPVPAHTVRAGSSSRKPKH